MDFTDETIPMPRIGDQAPVFDAVTTQGKIHFPLDFNGKWIILFSHPSDFTPVCTSEDFLSTVYTVILPGCGPSGKRSSTKERKMLRFNFR